VECVTEEKEYSLWIGSKNEEKKPAMADSHQSPGVRMGRRNMSFRRTPRGWSQGKRMKRLKRNMKPGGPGVEDREMVGDIISQHLGIEPMKEVPTKIEDMERAG
jgi:hypothetical protein